MTRRQWPPCLAVAGLFPDAPALPSPLGGPIPRRELVRAGSYGETPKKTAGEQGKKNNGRTDSPFSPSWAPSDGAGQVEEDGPDE